MSATPGAPWWLRCLGWLLVGAIVLVPVLHFAGYLVLMLAEPSPGMWLAVFVMASGLVYGGYWLWVIATRIDRIMKDESEKS